MMRDVLVPVRDLEFQLFDWLRLDRNPQYDRQTVSAVLDLASRVASESYLPQNRAADIEEPRLVNGRVKILPGLVSALQGYAELGLCGLSFPERLGGMGFPQSVSAACHAIFASANIAATGYTMLTAANARLLMEFASDRQIEEFARPQIAGRWFGTMCLSEPQAGSSLADIRCRAVEEGGDEFGRRYRLRGNKMWISGGDQDVTENIVHLVLAKVPLSDGTLPQGTKGISLFIVPRLLPDGAVNDIATAGLNHKLGYRGTANCLLNFGEGPGAIGWLVGSEGDGIRQMFKMMNEARVQVGTGAAALAIRSHREAVNYAGERLQGRVAGQPGGAPVAIFRHPDVRRSLLQQKSYGEGALALCLLGATLTDKKDADAALLLDLLTPILKSWPSEFGLIANDVAIQLHGGYGYTRDFAVEQLWRDNRLNPIHEGTTAIQGIDLLERKVLKNGPRNMALLGERIADAAHAHPDNLGGPVLKAWARLAEVVEVLRDRPLAWRLQDSTLFLRAFGHVVVAWLWLELDHAARQSDDIGFSRGKTLACRYFLDVELPQAIAWVDTISQGSDLASMVDEAVF